MTYDDGLVEAVAKAVEAAEPWSTFWSSDDAKSLARAAIAAVLEWQKQQPDYTIVRGDDPLDIDESVDLTALELDLQARERRRK